MKQNMRIGLLGAMLDDQTCASFTQSGNTVVFDFSHNAWKVQLFMLLRKQWGDCEDMSLRMVLNCCEL